MNIIIPVAVTALVLLVGPRLLGFFMPFVIAWVIALIANPLVRFLEKRLKIVRKAGTLLIVAGVLAGIICGGYYLIVTLARQLFGFIQDLPEMWAELEKTITDAGSVFMDKLDLLPGNIQDTLNSVGESITESIGELVSRFTAPTIEAAGSVAKRIPDAFVSVVITILSSYFFIVERDNILEKYRKVAPEWLKRITATASEKTKKAVGGYFEAQFRIMAVVTAILFVGFMILRVSYSFLLAVLIAFLDFLPVFGTGTVLIPWAIIRFIGGDYYFAIGLIVIYIITQVVRQLIQPKIVGDSLGLPPLTTLFFLYIGFQLKGIGGMILAVPIGMIAIEIYKMGIYQPVIDGVKELIEVINDFRHGGNKEE